VQISICTGSLFLSGRCSASPARFNEPLGSAEVVRRQMSEAVSGCQFACVSCLQPLHRMFKSKYASRRWCNFLEGLGLAVFVPAPALRAWRDSPSLGARLWWSQGRGWKPSSGCQFACGSCPRPHHRTISDMILKPAPRSRGTGRCCCSLCLACPTDTSITTTVA